MLVLFDSPVDFNKELTLGNVKKKMLGHAQSHKFINNLDTISEKSNEENEFQKNYNFRNAKNSLIDELKNSVPNLMPKNMLEL